MESVMKPKRKLKLPFHIVKRLDMPKSIYWVIKSASFIVALLLAGVLCTILRSGTFGTFYAQMFLGIFDPEDPEILFEFLETMGILLLVAFALAPAFKMRFWNIGGEGQILISCLVTAGICKFGPANDALLIVLGLFAGVLAGALWAVIPAIFKAFFNTNETLFTLMMNYIAIGLIEVFIDIWIPSKTHSVGTIPNGHLPELFDTPYLTSIVIIAVVITVMVIYMKKTKQGYELSVVGESSNTARYVGINVKKVIIRTMLISGALCGLAGFLLVSGHHYTLSSTLSNGRGFTGVLIAWLGGFEPGPMVLYSGLVAFFQCGSENAASYVGMNAENFSPIITGMFFLIVIASEFFVNYRFVLSEKLALVVGKMNYYCSLPFKKIGKLFKRKEKVSENLESETEKSKETKEDSGK